MTVSAVLTHYYNAQRLDNLRRLVAYLRPQVDEVVVWNNDEPFGELPGARVIQADHNWGCQGRFEAARHVDSDLVLFHDNDLMATKPGLVAKFTGWMASHPGSICTATGRELDPATFYYYLGAVPSFISLRRQWRPDPQPMLINMTHGRIELHERALLMSLLEGWPNSVESEHDDLWLSARAVRRGVDIWLIPIGETGEENVDWVELPGQDVGYSHTDPDFKFKRAAECVRIYRGL